VYVCVYVYVFSYSLTYLSEAEKKILLQSFKIVILQQYEVPLRIWLKINIYFISKVCFILVLNNGVQNSTSTICRMIYKSFVILWFKFVVKPLVILSVMLAASKASYGSHCYWTSWIEIRKWPLKRKWVCYIEQNNCIGDKSFLCTSEYEFFPWSTMKPWSTLFLVQASLMDNGHQIYQVGFMCIYSIFRQWLNTTSN
jgi:hypothetical protein